MGTASVRLVFSVCLALLLGACGGGGGGGASDTARAGFYGGYWDGTLTQVINDCEVDIPRAVTVELLVNQDGERVVVNSGNMVLTGTTNNEDGFFVSDVAPAANGRRMGTGFSFKNASDGSADVGLALILQCGARQCSVGYGGLATLRSSKAASSEKSQFNTIDSVQQGLVAGAGQGGAESDSRPLAEVASEVAELVTPAL